jgi:DNA transposition AAA+ family ATPase
MPVPNPLAARARARLQLAHGAQPERAYDHIANAIQLLLSAEAALTALEIIENADGPAHDLQECLRAAQARCFRALFALAADEVEAHL